MTGAEPLAGAWRRSGLTVAGVAVAERCDVLWLQPDRWYPDMRPGQKWHVPAGLSSCVAAGAQWRSLWGTER